MERAERSLRQRPHDGVVMENLVRAAERLPGGLGALIDRWQVSLRAQPSEPALLEGTARLLVRAGQLQSAAQLLTGAGTLGGCPTHVLLLSADIANRRGLQDDALALQRRALSCTTEPALRHAVLRSLRQALLEQGAIEEARAVHRELTSGARDPGTLRSWPDTLAARGLHAEAAAALLELAERASRKLELLRDAALELLAANRGEQALAVVQRALSGATASQRSELSAIEEQAARRAGKLSTLAERLDASRKPADRFRAAQLWAELGDDLRSEQALRVWLKASPNDLRGLRALAALQQRGGRRDEAEWTLRRLAQLAPNDPHVIASYVELLRAMGRDSDAVALLTRAAVSAPVALQLKVSDLLGRMGQTEQRRVLLKRLIRLEPGEPDHVLALGELELSEGESEAALATWRGLLSRNPSRAGGLVMLAEVLGDHGLIDEALATLEQALALQPDSLALRRKRASLLERAGQGAAAESEWQWVLDQPGADPETQREARAHLVSLWKRLAAIPMRARMLTERVRGSTDDCEARRLLAEIFGRDPQRAENELELIDRLASSSNNDPEVLRPLAALHVRRDDVGRALALLERLAELVPEGAVDNLGRAVELSLSHYRDDDALHYARRAVALMPDDPLAHRLAARVHQRRHELPSAIEAYRRVVALKPSAFDTRLQLAEMVAGSGDASTASGEWLTVLGGAADDEQVLDAARRLMELPDDVLAGRLEQALLTVQQAQPARALYRRLLVEWYSRGRVPNMVVRPLLETLDDPDGTLRASAVALLARARSAGTAQPLLARVERMASRHEAASALIAVGKIGDAGAVLPLLQLLPRLEPKLKPSALWALRVLTPEGAVDAARGLLADGDAGVRAVAALTLAPATAADAGRLRSALAVERHPIARAALVWTLGELGAAADQPLFRAELAAPWPGSAAALYGLRNDRDQLARTLLSGDAELRRAAAQLWRPGADVRRLPAPSWPFDARTYVASVLAQPLPPRARSLQGADGTLVARAVRALLHDPAAAEVVLGSIVSDGVVLAPSALLALGVCPSEAFAAAFWQEAGSTVERMAEDVGSPGRGAALVLLARAGRAGHPAVATALASDDPTGLRDRLLEALRYPPALPLALRGQLRALFASSPDWPTRWKVARLLAGENGTREQSHEPIALVRLALVTPKTPVPRLLCHVPRALN